MGSFMALECPHSAIGFHTISVKFHTFLWNSINSPWNIHSSPFNHQLLITNHWSLIISYWIGNPNEIPMKTTLKSDLTTTRRWTHWAGLSTTEALHSVHAVLERWNAQQGGLTLWWWPVIERSSFKVNRCMIHSYEDWGISCTYRRYSFLWICK